MLQFDEYKVKLNNLAPTLEELGKALEQPGEGSEGAAAHQEFTG